MTIRRREGGGGKIMGKLCHSQEKAGVGRGGLGKLWGNSAVRRNARVENYAKILLFAGKNGCGKITVVGLGLVLMKLFAIFLLIEYCPFCLAFVL